MVCVNNVIMANNTCLISLIRIENFVPLPRPPLHVIRKFASIMVNRNLHLARQSKLLTPAITITLRMCYTIASVILAWLPVAAGGLVGNIAR